MKSPLAYIATVLFLLTIVSSSQAQKNDYIWLFGYDNIGTSDSVNFRGRKVDFNADTLSVTEAVKIADFDACNVSYCDNDGKLLFYSNCGDVFDTRDSVMLGGDSINYGQDWERYQSTTKGFYRYNGLNTIQGILALPKPGNPNSVYLCHYSLNFVMFTDGSGSFPTDSSYYSLINTLGNSGFGEVIAKNKILNADTLTFSMFSAVRHGNGRDWWILHPYYKGNCNYEFLLTDTGIGLHSIQCLGEGFSTYSFEDIGTSCFSPNGEKYFWATATDGIRIFDFDRCTGQLSNPVQLSFPFVLPQFSVASGIAVSPNNRYLYVTTNRIALQFDLQSNDIQASVDTVAIYDGYLDPRSFPTNFFIAQIGPDGKIYISSTGGSTYLHVINRPDEKGDSCLFVQRGLNLTTYNYESLPNFPNYRLGRSVGSACDTLWTNVDEVTIQNREKILKVFPNPAMDLVTVDYGFTDWSKPAPVQLVIVNELGQIVYQQELPRYSGFQKIDVCHFATGLYTAYVKRSNNIVAVSKFAKE